MENLALQGQITDFERWQIIAGLEARERAEDDQKMEEVLLRAGGHPGHFLLSVIGHLDGQMIAREITATHHSMVTGKLWAIYIHLPSGWKGLEV